MVLFTHRNAGARAAFRRICATRGCVEASHGHYVYAGGRLTAAGEVAVGDATSAGTVVSVADVVSTGLYNPHTASGDIAVDGFRASCYTTRVETCTGHALLAPVRMFGWALPRAVAWLGDAVERVAEKGLWTWWM